MFIYTCTLYIYMYIYIYAHVHIYSSMLQSSESPTELPTHTSLGRS